MQISASSSYKAPRSSCFLPAGKMRLERGALGRRRKPRFAPSSREHVGIEGDEAGEEGVWSRGGAVAIHCDAPMKMVYSHHSFSSFPSCHLLPQPPDCMFSGPQYNPYFPFPSFVHIDNAGSTCSAYYSTLHSLRCLSHTTSCMKCTQ